MAKIKSRYGFTLVELLVVMIILTLLAALSIPLLLRARHNANEAAAVSSLRVIHTACVNYYPSQTPPTYPPDLASLNTATPPYINSSLTGATTAANARRGYFYTYTLVNSNQFTCRATPEIIGTTGTRVLFVDETGVIRVNNATGTPVE